MIAWLTLCIKGLTERPIYAFCGYMMTFLLAPQLWWWGDPLTQVTTRWNLITACIFAFSALSRPARDAFSSSISKLALVSLAFYTLNCLVVHFFNASNPIESWKTFDLVWKSAVLVFFLKKSIHSYDDIKVALLAMFIMCTFVGWQIVVNDAGSVEKGRLEGINFPGASGSNGSAAVMAFVLPAAGFFFMTKHFRYSFQIVILGAPLVLDSLLRFSSRGSYLGLLASGLALFAYSDGTLRKQSAKIFALGILGFFLLANNASIWERLFSVTADEQNRDASAQERIDCWNAAVQMIKDHPFGTGGRSAFVSPLGLTYIPHIRTTYRSVHNGYLNIAAGWGLQGICILLFIILIGAASVRKGIRMLPKTDASNRFLGAVLISMTASQLVTTTFGDYLDGEWFLWIVTLSIAYLELCEKTRFQHGNEVGSMNPTAESTI